MNADHSSLGNRAFAENADALITVRYRSHQDALSFLQATLRAPNGIGLLHGPVGAGKTITVRELAMQFSQEADVAYVDGNHLKPRTLLTWILNQFGHSTNAETDEQLQQMLLEFAMEQAGSWQAPIIIIDDVDRMYPSTLRILNNLIGLGVTGRYILRFIFTGFSGLQSLLDSSGMSNLMQRDPQLFSMQPLTPKETMIYLHARLQAAGSDRADTVFPFDVCDRLREQSEGWPGVLNRYALEAIKRASGFPISVVDTYTPASKSNQKASRLPPRLIITRDGELVSEFTFKDRKVLIGRSDFADILVDDDFVSKIHAVLLLYADALVLLDLNSSNGTTVNSVSVSKTILSDDDIISLGNHRLKVANAPEISDEVRELMKSPDTIKMKNLVDLRRARARKNVQSI